MYFLGDAVRLSDAGLKEFYLRGDLRLGEIVEMIGDLIVTCPARFFV